MSFLDDVISTAKDVATTAGDKTDKAVKFSKLKIREAQLNGELKCKYEKLGQMIYDMVKSGVKEDEAFNAAIAEIDAAKAEIADIGSRIDALKNEVTCPACGAKTKNDNSFCPKCGAKLPVVETPAEEAPAAEEKIEDVKPDDKKD
ncbi:MAG: zinc ribbon domain-containing protein [Oscillospiraceae bacterium]